MSMQDILFKKIVMVLLHWILLMGFSFLSMLMVSVRTSIAYNQ
jgi:hypothetical protein